MRTDILALPAAHPRRASATLILLHKAGAPANARDELLDQGLLKWLVHAGNMLNVRTRP
ncbi:MAG: hypothetical protein ACOZB0_05755 [Pseudomonadota bacterium]